MKLLTLLLLALSSPPQARTTSTDYKDVRSEIEHGRIDAAWHEVESRPALARDWGLWLAHDFLRAGALESAESLLVQCRSTPARSDRIRGELGRLAAVRGDEDTALELLTDVNYRPRAGVLLHLGRQEEAETCWTKYLECYLDEKVRQQLVNATRDAGRFEEAYDYAVRKFGGRPVGGSGFCALGASIDADRTKWRGASLLLALGRFDEADRVQVPRDYRAWYPVARHLGRLGKLAGLRQVSVFYAEGLPIPGEWTADAVLRLMLEERSELLWQVALGHTGGLSKGSPPLGLRTAALARLGAVANLNDPMWLDDDLEHELLGLALLAMHGERGIVNELEARIRPLIWDESSHRRRSLLYLLTVEGSPEAYDVLRSLRTASDRSFELEVGRTLVRFPPYERVYLSIGRILDERR